MLRIIQTFNAHAINDGTNYRAVLLNPTGLATANLVYLDQTNADPEDAGVFTVDKNTLTLQIEIANYASRITLVSQLLQWFERGTLGDLVVKFMDDGLTYARPCRVVNLVQDPSFPRYFIATLNTGWSAWRAVTADSTVLNLTGTGGSYALNLLGDTQSPLSAIFQVSAVGSYGYLYQQLYQLLNAPQTVNPLGYGPWCMTIDTASLVADSANSCLINAVGGITAVATTIPYDTVTGVIPAVGVGYVDTEQIAWTGKTGTTSGNLTGVTRGMGGTTAATHADNAVIKFSYVQANCADLRIFINAKEANRWIVNPNNASTLVWFNLTLNQGYTLALKTAIASSGTITYIEFAVTPNVLSALTAMPNEGILVHGTEWIKYKGKDLLNYRLIVTQRGTLNTTKQEHATGDIFTYMENVITVCFGNIAAVDPATLDATYDNTKPLFKLASSTNSSWVYDNTTQFIDLARTGRTGGFTPEIYQSVGGVSNTYNLTQTTGPDPAMGMQIKSFIGNTGWVSERSSLAFLFYRGCGINMTTFTGEKYLNASLWPTTAGLQNSSDGATYTNVWNETSPPRVTWTALGSHSAIAMNSQRWMRLLFDGVVPAGSNNSVLFEILTCTITFVSANLPTASLLGRATSVQLDLALNNAANNNTLKISLALLLNVPLVLDGEAKTVQYHNLNAFDVIKLDTESRDWWIILKPGTNNLTLTAIDVGTLAVTLSWYRRRY